MAFHMEREMVGSREGSLADVAFEGFVSSVLPEVSRQLVRSSESPSAAFPVAHVRLLACGVEGKNIDNQYSIKLYLCYTV